MYNSQGPTQQFTGTGDTVFDESGPISYRASALEYTEHSDFETFGAILAGALPAIIGADCTDATTSTNNKAASATVVERDDDMLLLFVCVLFFLLLLFSSYFRLKLIILRFGARNNIFLCTKAHKQYNKNKNNREQLFVNTQIVVLRKLSLKITLITRLFNYFNDTTTVAAVAVLMNNFCLDLQTLLRCAVW